MAVVHQQVHSTLVHILVLIFLISLIFYVAPIVFRGRSVVECLEGCMEYREGMKD